MGEENGAECFPRLAKSVGQEWRDFQADRLFYSLVKARPSSEIFNNDKSSVGFDQ